MREEYTPEDRLERIVETKSGVVCVTKNLTVLGGGVYDGRYNVSLVDDINGAVAAAKEIGYPVVVKVDAETILHKSDVGGVEVFINDEERLKAAVEKMQKKFAEHKPRFFVQRCLTGGQELIVGAKLEPNLGHLIMFGLGGIHVELLKDVSWNVVPITDTEADDMLASIKAVN